MSLRILNIVVIGLIGVLSGNGLYASGYNTLINYGEGFLAAGSDGRIDWVAASGNIVKSEKYDNEHFNCLLSIEQSIVVAGDRGSVMISLNKGPLQKVNSGTNQNIHSLALFQDMIFAGCDDGELLIGNEEGVFHKVKLALQGNIVSLSANHTVCFGVTDMGEIIRSVNGADWTIFKFNEFYAGYYKTCHFTRILVMDDLIAVTGKYADGTPALLFSSQGNVWTERMLNYTDDQGIPAMLEEIPYDLLYNADEDQLFLSCSKGKVMMIPSCSQCNKLYSFTTSDLKGIAYNKNTFMIAGENYYTKAISK